MQKGFGFLGILLVVAIVAGIGAFTFDSLFPDKSPFAPSKEEKNAIDMAEQMKDVLEQKNADTKQDETADWKTYRNEEYGFEFKYPESVTITNNDPEHGHVFLELIDKTQIFGVQPFEPTINDTRAQQQSPLGAKFVEKRLVDGRDAYYYYAETTDYGSKYYHVYIIGNTEISFYARPENKNIFEKILSTFKFLP